MIFAILSCLFIFLGMFIGNRYDLKKISINAIFGLFTINVFQCISSAVYPLLYRNYHNSSWLFILLGILLGYLVIKLINCKYEDSDNISILGFTVVNSYLFILHNFNIIFLIINIFYYVFIGVYISKSKSWIYVLLGCFLGIILSLIKVWSMGYIYGITIGFVVYFILSVYNIVFRCKDKKSLAGLIVGFLIALLGGLI